MLLPSKAEFHTQCEACEKLRKRKRGCIRPPKQKTKTRVLYTSTWRFSCLVKIEVYAVDFFSNLFSISIRTSSALIVLDVVRVVSKDLWAPAFCSIMSTDMFAFMVRSQQTCSHLYWEWPGKNMPVEFLSKKIKGQAANRNTSPAFI